MIIYTGLFTDSHTTNTTLFTILLSAFSILLANYSTQEDISIGTPVLGRLHHSLERLIGFFVNTIILRNNLSNNPSYFDFLKNTQKMCLEAFSHQEIPFEKLVEKLAINRDPSRNPLFQVMFVFQPFDHTSLHLNDIKSTKINPPTIWSKFDITLALTLEKNHIKGSIEYNTDIFEKNTINNLISHYKNILANICSDPKQKIMHISLLDKHGTKKSLHAVNNPPIQYKNINSLVEVFHKSACMFPEKIALIYNEEHITYGVLNSHSNQIANFLLKRGVQKEELIGLCLSPSIEQITFMLGILKAGCAYVPLDPNYPNNRLEYIIL